MNSRTKVKIAILEDCMRNGNRLKGANMVLLTNGISTVKYQEYLFYARALANNNNTEIDALYSKIQKLKMQQRNIDAIAWHGRGK